ncbi:MAG TPA: DUF445 domain-containing protein [Xanthobacteraceae bacterium]|nr:DUF445 domain-containing protein [Xanthobacteraceae bacterium]
MRAVATLLLVLMTMIYVATLVVNADWVGIPYVRAFAEAGMVGACADWFAIVALFRRPLGLPIPHTGIVPNNKQRIAVAVGRFITENFLSARVAHEWLTHVDPVGWIMRWIDDPAGARRAVETVRPLLPQIITALPARQIGEFLGSVARFGIESVPAAPLASKVVTILWAQGEAQRVLDRAVGFAERALVDNKEFISRKVAEKSSRWVPRWIDNIIAEKVMSGLLDSIREMRDPAHPWRVELRETVETLIADLANDPEMYARGEALKTELLADPLFVEQARILWAEIESGLTSDPDAHARTIAGALEAGLLSLGRWLQDDAGRRARLNRWMRLAILRVVLPRRVAIGAYVTHVVQRWDSAMLVDRLELTVGKDLQFIRINGTLVGGLVGLVIYTVSTWITAP